MTRIQYNKELKHYFILSLYSMTNRRSINKQDIHGIQKSAVTFRP